jgi:RNA polymerase sigma-70 factor, ECF subfamily
MLTLKEINQSAETELVDKASLGDLDAFNQLVLSYQDLVYNNAFYLLGDHATAEDATQDSFIRAFQGLKNFRGGSFRAWLLKINTNICYDILRQTKRRPTTPLFPENEDGEESESPAWLIDPNPGVHTLVEQNELSGKIYQMICELPEVYRNVLTLVDLYELDYAEAAQTLNVPVGTVKSRLARARQQMRDKLRSNRDFANDFAVMEVSSAAMGMN